MNTTANRCALWSLASVMPCNAARPWCCARRTATHAVRRAPRSLRLMMGALR